MVDYNWTLGWSGTQFHFDLALLVILIELGQIKSSVLSTINYISQNRI